MTFREQQVRIRTLGWGLLASCAFATPVMATDGEAKPDPYAVASLAAIEVPDLSFAEKANDVENYDKYFYFHRENTDFDTALADFRECDGYARGLSYSTGNAAVPYPYAGTLAGGVGTAIGNAMADAIFGSAERRKQRRTNLRSCMFFKEYQRYGMTKDIWVTFNFEEGNGQLSDEERAVFILKQAKIASGPKPLAKDIGE
jgi:hypothetical protein